MPDLGSGEAVSLEQRVRILLAEGEATRRSLPTMAQEVIAVVAEEIAQRIDAGRNLPSPLVRNTPQFLLGVQQSADIARIVGGCPRDHT